MIEKDLEIAMTIMVDGGENSLVGGDKNYQRECRSYWGGSSIWMRFWMLLLLASDVFDESCLLLASMSADMRAGLESC